MVAILNFMAVKILPKGQIFGGLRTSIYVLKAIIICNLFLVQQHVPQTIYMDKFLSSAFILRSQTGPNSVLLVLSFKLNCFCFGKNLLCLYI